MSGVRGLPGCVRPLLANCRRSDTAPPPGTACSPAQLKRIIRCKRQPRARDAQEFTPSCCCAGHECHCRRDYTTIWLQVHHNRALQTSASARICVRAAGHTRIWQYLTRLLTAQRLRLNGAVASLRTRGPPNGALPLSQLLHQTLRAETLIEQRAWQSVWPGTCCVG